MRLASKSLPSMDPGPGSTPSDEKTPALRSKCSLARLIGLGGKAAALAVCSMAVGTQHRKTAVNPLEKKKNSPAQTSSCNASMFPISWGSARLEWSIFFWVLEGKL